MTSAKQATPHRVLINELMDSRVPKTEREHAAAREIERLRERLASPVKESLTTEQAETVAWRTFDGEGGYDYRTYDYNENYRGEYIRRNGTKYANWVEPLYTAPQPRQWVGLTDEEIDQAVKSCNTTDTYKYFRAVEAKLKEKNG